MQENEEYGVVITAITQYFKRGMQELSRIIKNFGKEAEEETTIAPKLETDKFEKQYQKQIDYVKAQMEEIKTVLSEPGKMEPIDIAEQEDAYERLYNKLQDLLIKQEKAEAKKFEPVDDEVIEEVEDFNEELEETNKISNKTKSSLSTLFDGSIGKIKRFTYYLLGARSVFSLFMKYRSAYYQFNEEMQYQSELSQNAIALSLGPAFEFLGNVIAYASIGLAKFIQLLTGVNVLSKVTTKGIKNYNKSLKETQTLVTGIDEITNLTNPQNLGLADQYRALDEFRKKIQEVEEFFKKNEWIQALVDGIKDVYNYIKEHWDILKYIFGAVAIGLVSRNFTFGISIIGLAGFITFVKALEDYNKAKEEYDKNHIKTHDLIMNNFKEMSTNYLNDMTKQLKGINKESKEWKNGVDDIKRTLPSVLNDIRNGELTYEEYKPTIDEWVKTLKDLDGEKFKPEIDFLMNLNGSKDDIKLIQQYFETGTPTTKVIDYSISKSTTDAVNNFKKNLEDIFKKNYKLKVKLDFAELGKGASAGAVALSEAIAKAIRGYANGLDYVPYDNYPALLHKGEAVVPAKYNPTIHSQGNEYTNALLETLVMKMDDLAQRPNVFEIDGQQFANATYGLYDNERKRQGYVEGVVR